MLVTKIHTIIGKGNGQLLNIQPTLKITKGDKFFRIEMTNNNSSINTFLQFKIKPINPENIKNFKKPFESFKCWENDQAFKPYQYLILMLNDDKKSFTLIGGDDKTNAGIRMIIKKEEFIRAITTL